MQHLVQGKRRLNSHTYIEHIENKEPILLLLMILLSASKSNLLWFTKYTSRVRRANMWNGEILMVLTSSLPNHYQRDRHLVFRRCRFLEFKFGRFRFFFSSLLGEKNPSTDGLNRFECCTNIVCILCVRFILVFVRHGVALNEKRHLLEANG